MTINLDEIRNTIPKRELRQIPGHVEVRAGGEQPTIGVFIPYSSRSEEMFGFTEIIAPGAFARTISNGRRAKKGGDIRALWQHDPAWVLGRQANRTLELSESEKGLDAEIIVAPGEIRWHADALASIQRGDVDGSSFGFEMVKEEWDESTMTRTLLEVKLFEVSPVTFPAYAGASSEQRSVLDALMVKTGVDTRELAAMLNAADGGRVPEASGDQLRSWIDRLTGFLPLPPEPEIPEVDWAARLAIRERLLRVADVGA